MDLSKDSLLGLWMAILIVTWCSPCIHAFVQISVHNELEAHPMSLSELITSATTL